MELVDPLRAGDSHEWKAHGTLTFIDTDIHHDDVAVSFAEGYISVDILIPFFVGAGLLNANTQVINHHDIR